MQKDTSITFSISNKMHSNQIRQKAPNSNHHDLVFWEGLSIVFFLSVSNRGNGIEWIT